MDLEIALEIDEGLIQLSDLGECGLVQRRVARLNVALGGDQAARQLANVMLLANVGRANGGQDIVLQLLIALL